MSRKGNDLVRGYLWNAARSGITHNPAIAALYRRLRAKGKRGDVALGHCMRKLLHLVYAVWKTNRPFDDQHFPGETPNAAATTAVADTAQAASGHETAAANNETAVGHKRDEPAKPVVTTATATVEPTVSAVKPSPTVKPSPLSPTVKPSPNRSERPKIDYAFLRQQVSMEQVLSHLGLAEQLRGHGLQRRGRCPLHARAEDTQPTFSVHLGKKVFQCFHADCRAHGNVLDLWAAVHKLPLYEAALHLAGTFQLRRNREEEPVS
jgi:hypothetical protein